MGAKPTKEPPQAGLRKGRLPREQSFNDGVWGGGDVDSITRLRVIFEPSVPTSDLSAITINGSNYNSALHNAFQVIKHTGMQYTTSSLVYTCELRLPNFTLHTMEKPRRG